MLQINFRHFKVDLRKRQQIALPFTFSKLACASFGFFFSSLFLFLFLPAIRNLSCAAHAGKMQSRKIVFSRGSFPPVGAWRLLRNLRRCFSNGEYLAYERKPNADECVNYYPKLSGVLREAEEPRRLPINKSARTGNEVTSPNLGYTSCFRRQSRVIPIR